MEYDRATLVELDRRHVWHPYTQMLEYSLSDPVVVERGEGRRLYDVDGTAYWDGVSSIWLNVHGHRVPEIDRALIEQIGKVAHSTLLGAANVPSILLARRLVELAPRGLTRVFFSDDGSTAVESAIKIALQYWVLKGQPERTRILTLEGAYHGDTLGAVGVAPVPTFHKPFLSVLPTPLQVPFPYCYRCPWGKEPTTCGRECEEALGEVLENEGSRVAAVLVEPIVAGVLGIVPMPEGYLRTLREMTRRHGILLIADEVATGLGRTGRMFACEHEGVSPDLLCIGKGLSGGYLPMAATLATEEIYSAFLGRYSERKQFFHGHSYTGNPLGAAASLANLDLLERILPDIPTKEKILQSELRKLLDHPFVGDVRVKGLMAGVELVVDRPTKKEFPWESQAGYVVARHARKRGLLLRPIGSVVVFMPPLGSTVEELHSMLSILLRAFEDSLGDLGRVAREWGR